MQQKKKGIINPNGVSLEKHEYDTILFLTTLGHNIELIPPSHIPNRRTPDFRMSGLEWEMKSPKGKSRSTLEHAFQTAMKQSVNIIFDLRRIQMPNDRAVTTLCRLFDYSKSIRRLLIITKEQKLLEYNK